MPINYKIDEGDMRYELGGKLDAEGALRFDATFRGPTVGVSFRMTLKGAQKMRDDLSRAVATLEAMAAGVSGR